MEYVEFIDDVVSLEGLRGSFRDKYLFRVDYGMSSKLKVYLSSFKRERKKAGVNRAS